MAGITRTGVTGALLAATIRLQCVQAAMGMFVGVLRDTSEDQTRHARGAEAMTDTANPPIASAASKVIE